MKKLSIASTFKSPEILFDGDTGNLTITGRVFPENPQEFFTPIISWLNEYAANPKPTTVLELNLSYFNSTSNEYLFRCCKVMESLFDQGKDARIRWMYESDDEDMKQMGEDYRELLKINFEFQAIS
jgi:hypothetical protein